MVLLGGPLYYRAVCATAASTAGFYYCHTQRPCLTRHGCSEGLHFAAAGRGRGGAYLTYTLCPVEHRPQIALLHPVLSFAEQANLFLPEKKLTVRKV